MKLVPAICTCCSAKLTVDKTRDALICEYCGTPFIVEKAVSLYNERNNQQNDFEIVAGRLKKYRGSSLSIEIPDGVIDIGASVFSSMKNLVSVTIPESVRRIEYGAFRWCSGLKSIVLPQSLEFIGDYAFSECTSLKSISIPGEVALVGKSAFSGCVSLVNADISACKLDKSAFAECTSLRNLRLHNGVSEINGDVFRGCTVLENINIPKTLNRIKGFYAKTRDNDTVGAYDVVDDRPFSGCSLREVHFEEGVTAIGEFAFHGCHSIKSIHLPTSLQEIGEQAFYDCAVELSLPDNIIKIGKKAFAGCDIKNTSLPRKMTEVGEESFGYSGISIETISANVKKIGPYAFVGCRKLRNITILSKDCEIAEGAFSHCENLQEIEYGGKLPMYAIFDSPFGEKKGMCSYCTGHWPRTKYSLYDRSISVFGKCRFCSKGRKYK